MAYTMERLDQALKLFRKTKRQLVLDGFPVSYLENWIESKYSLRNRTLNRAKSLHSTWIDNDDSADYNPKDDFQPKRKRVTRPEGAAGPERETKRQKVRSKQDDDRLLVTLKIRSVEGKALLLSLSSDKDHKQRNDTHHQQTESYWFPSDLSSFSSSLSTLQRYSLRNRGQPTDSKYPWSSFQFSHSQGDHHSIIFSTGTQSLLSLDLGHPAARGCKSCWEFNHECSLLDKPLTYPCQICREDRVDCELIIPPKRKRGCENCKRRKKGICSYLKDARDHHLPCKQCQEIGIHCFAGPARPQQENQESEILHNSSQEEERSQDVPSCGSSSSHFHHSSPPARPVNLTEDIQPLSISADVLDLEDSGQHGNLKISSTNAHVDERKAFLLDILSKPWKPPTSSSTPKESQKPPTATATATKEEIKTETKQNQTSEKENTLTRQQQKKLEKSSTGIVRIITTSFAHPINFAYEPSSPKDKPCHFCTDFTYGMLGLGEVKVEVIDYRDGSYGYVEIEGGHTGSGHEPTRMCTTCALERVHIVNCPAHTIAPLEGYDPESFDYAAAFATLEPCTTTTTTPADGSSGDGGTPVIQNPWCMLCPNPAFFGCVTTQSLNKFQEPVTPSSPDAVGCGLLLCADCARLMQIFHCDVAKVVKRNRERDGQDGVRADAVYLLPGNDLYRFYCGDGDEEEEGGG